jgi:hypothetical protein
MGDPLGMAPENFSDYALAPVSRSRRFIALSVWSLMGSPDSRCLPGWISTEMVAGFGQGRAAGLGLGVES